eukprot:jgi/Mesvir1/25696/Mv01892-RA.1
MPRPPRVCAADMSRRASLENLSLLFVSVAMLLVPGTCQTAVPHVPCIKDQPSAGQITCTANDVYLATVTNITILDSDGGCTSPSDTVTFTAIFAIIAQSKTRYDAGLWFAEDRDNDGALRGVCTAATIPKAPSPPWHDEDSDNCGDMLQDELLQPMLTVTVPCRDVDQNSQLDLGYCITWQNNARQACISYVDTVPDAPSKCNCEPGRNINITVPECTVNADCVSSDVCSTLACINNKCVTTNTTSCNDGNICNGIETCDPINGCKSGTPLVCDDGDACNGVETCNHLSGCENGTAPVCDDGDACNGVETCNHLSGCENGTAPVCDDGDACNGVETCNHLSGCENGTAPVCDDGDACNGVETCNHLSGCENGTAPVCDDGDACNGVETCNHLSGCENGTAPVCDDGDACNGVETCNHLSGCENGTAPVCDDGDACNGVETCNHLSGCENGTAPVCDDGDACNGVETCNHLSGCENGTAPVCDDGDACNGVETCNHLSGCENGTAPVCDDGNACNGVETCNHLSGCENGTAPVCDDGNACNGVETCNHLSGCENGTAPVCDDGNACNGVETCEAANGCVPGAPPDCGIDNDVCDGREYCDPEDGCQVDESVIPVLSSATPLTIDIEAGECASSIVFTNSSIPVHITLISTSEDTVTVTALSIAGVTQLGECQLIVGAVLNSIGDTISCHVTVHTPPTAGTQTLVLTVSVVVSNECDTKSFTVSDGLTYATVTPPEIQLTEDSCYQEGELAQGAAATVEVFVRGVPYSVTNWQVTLTLMNGGYGGQASFIVDYSSQGNAACFNALLASGTDGSCFVTLPTAYPGSNILMLGLTGKYVDGCQNALDADVLLVITHYVGPAQLKITVSDCLENPIDVGGTGTLKVNVTNTGGVALDMDGVDVTFPNGTVVPLECGANTDLLDAGTLEASASVICFVTLSDVVLGGQTVTVTGTATYTDTCDRTITVRASDTGVCVGDYVQCLACPRTLEEFKEAARLPGGCWFSASTGPAGTPLGTPQINLTDRFPRSYADTITLWQPMVSENTFIKVNSANVNDLWKACIPCSSHDCVYNPNITQPCCQLQYEFYQFKLAKSDGVNLRVTTERFEMGAYGGWEILDHAGRTCVRLNVTHSAIRIDGKTYNLSPNDNLQNIVPYENRCLYVNVAGSADRPTLQWLNPVFNPWLTDPDFDPWV